MKMNLVLLIIFVPSCFAITGLQRAVALIRQPIHFKQPSRDIILGDFIGPLTRDAYKLQILRMRVGYAWEFVFTDYGFQRQIAGGIDLISNTKKIAIELKNGYHINSIVKRVNIERLKTFHRIHPDYQVILGCVNYKNAQGKVSHHGVVQLLYGNSLIDRFFRIRQAMIIRQLKAAVQSHFR